MFSNWFGKRKAAATTTTTTTARPKGYAVCVGLNRVDAEAYGGWNGQLTACENDARDMARLLSGLGYEVTTLLGTLATTAMLRARIQDAAKRAVSGDIVVVTSSSHGGQVRDTDGTETDGLDETICLYDRQLIDDELEHMWSMFCAGVRVMFVSDSCHSGTVVRALGSDVHVPGAKTAPRDATTANYAAKYLDILAAKAAARTRSAIKASVLSFGACQDNQTAMDGPANGAFTGALLRALRVYPDAKPGALIAHVRSVLPPVQSPTYVYAGPRDPVYEATPTFSITQL